MSAQPTNSSSRPFMPAPPARYKGESIIDQSNEIVQELAKAMLDEKSKTIDAKSKSLKKRLEYWTLDQLEQVEYSQATISNKLKDRSMTLNQFKNILEDEGWKETSELELVEYDPGKFTSLNNRRLFCLKKILEEGKPTALRRGTSPESERSSIYFKDNSKEYAPNGRIKQNKLIKPWIEKYVHVSVIPADHPCNSKEITSLQNNIKKYNHHFKTNGLEFANIKQPTYLDKLALRVSKDQPEVLLGAIRGHNGLVVYKKGGVPDLGKSPIPVGYKSVVVRQGNHKNFFRVIDS